MIKLEKNGRTMEARTQVQASAFLNNGWKIKEEVSIKVELTDEVPDGALETNADGSVNAYDESGNLVGTVDSDTVKGLQESVSIDEAPKKSTRAGRGK